MKKVLLTGGAGFIGSHVADLLAARGSEIVIYDNLSFGSKRYLPASARFEYGELCDRTRLIELFKQEDFDCVIHLAAIHFIPYCNQYPDRACRTNVEGTQNILDSALATGTVKKLLIASTAAVYPDVSGPISESIGRAPMDVYGMTKSANEEQAAIYARKADTHVSVGRFFNAVGARETNQHLVPDILTRISTAEQIEIGNISPKRDYIDVRDLAASVIRMIERNTDRIDTCNLGTGNAYDVQEITALISAIHQRPITLAPAERLMRKIERQNLQADVSKMKAKYDWTPQYTIADSVKYAYDWFNQK